MMTKNAKKIGIWVFGSLVGGGLGLTILGMAMQFWINNAVDAKLQQVSEQGDPPAIVTLNNRMGLVEDGISDNALALADLKDGQEEFNTLFIDYLREQAQ